MISQTFTFTDPSGQAVFVYSWLPDEGVPLRGALQIAHGMVETAARYERFASALTEAGYAVYANDHLGHGQTAGDVSLVGTSGDDGFRRMVEHMRRLNGIIRERYPQTPLFLFGQSMGSFLAQRYASDYGDTIRGVILSAASGNMGPIIHAGVYLAKREMKRKGPHYRSKLLRALTFGGYNRSFRPTRTEYDFLSRDPEEVDKYINDPYCGVTATSQFYYNLFTGLRDIHKMEQLERIPKKLSIHLLSGDRDPLGKNGKGVLRLYRTFRKLGIEDVTIKLYPGGRHEMLNETNRDEVFRDMIGWLDERAR
ncbi:alpha/beta hydrolase [Paenibacillus thermotolerans]|uniref:alpha/beta hydrolase n=1 Tax=Paenibacillus thermotolerans TaxID=3027807 RepID=UPI002368125C|nr:MULTISPECIES: alpha/beta hydrolase [unclassified Paenibacillus]